MITSISSHTRCTDERAGKSTDKLGQVVDSDAGIGADPFLGKHKPGNEGLFANASLLTETPRPQP